MKRNLIMNRTIARLLAIGAFACMVAGCCSAKKNKDWCGIRNSNAECDLQLLHECIVLPNSPMTLNNIISIAFERNLDLIIKQHEHAIQKEIACRDMFKMLPSLTLNGELSGRDNRVSKRSLNLGTGVLGSPSQSTEHTTKKFDATLAWSVLDFGLSFYRARQEHNRSLRICLEHQRTRQNLIFDIIREYWKAVVAWRAVEGAEEIITEAQGRREDLERQVRANVLSEIEALRHEDRLISIQIQLQGFEREYLSAKTELAKLMGLPPGQHFDIHTEIVIKTEMDEIPEIDELEQCALYNRPELFAEDMQQHIMADEVRAAFLKFFPNTTLFSSYNYDGNKFIMHNDWLSAGVKVAWNLLSIPENYHNHKSAKQRVCLARESRLKLSIGVMTQVHLAHLRYLNAQAQFDLSDDLSRVKTHLLQAGKREKQFGVIHGDTILDYKIDALFADINQLRAFAEVQISLEQLNNAIGMPLRFNNLVTQDEEPDTDTTPVDVEAQMPSDDQPLTYADSDNHQRTAQVGGTVTPTQQLHIYESTDLDHTLTPSQDSFSLQQQIIGIRLDPSL
ncbi:Uncharacterized protein SCG7086_BH_00050 [Chlamydiales bacterium SCGC AG-110-P3]|nr:Uncharacterized protein SCG7086_BH_00050 [Chlamydiales bacterium SCGC AG-110-P3]